MQVINFKDITESLTKMTDIRLNVAIFVTCIFLVYISPSDKFILDPFPKVIIQALILITLVRIVFATIAFAHEIIQHHNQKKREEQKKIKEIAQLKTIENERINSAASLLKKLDVLQLKIIKDLQKSNTITAPKTAVLFSLKSLGVIQSVSTGKTVEGVSLTPHTLAAIERHYDNSLVQLEHDSILRFFNSLEKNELNNFEDMLEIDFVRTYYTSGNRLHETKYHRTFESFRNSILFEHPIRDYHFRLSTSARAVLVELKAQVNEKTV